MCRTANRISDWPERNRRCRPPPHPPPPPPTPNKPLLFFFLKHEFPSYTTHAPLPFCCSLTTCICALSCPSRPCRPSSPPFSCMFSFSCGYHGIIVFHMTHFFTSQRQTGGKKESNAFSESASPSQLVKQHSLEEGGVHQYQPTTYFTI